MKLEQSWETQRCRDCAEDANLLITVYLLCSLEGRKAVVAPFSSLSCVLQ
jgi:hypothetical protein